MADRARDRANRPKGGAMDSRSGGGKSRRARGPAGVPTGAEPDAALRMIEGVVALFLGRPRRGPKSRRDGRLYAAADVRRYLVAEVLGDGPAEIARREGRDRSTIRKSIERGRRLAMAAAVAGELEDLRDADGAA
jgi:hypothetical protein